MIFQTASFVEFGSLNCQLATLPWCRPFAHLSAKSAFGYLD